jgi:hypothetical protein
MSSPNSSLKKPSSISKLALLRSNRFIAQSKVISFRGDRGCSWFSFHNSFAYSPGVVYQKKNPCANDLSDTVTAK